jgi:bifunctional non-homologous end joining protein LigD
VATEKKLTAWTLSRQFRLAPSPTEAAPKRGDRLELAWDGHRVIACRAGDDIRLFSADAREWTKPFSPVVGALRKLAAREIVLDGFLCALDEQGRPSFDALRDHVRTPKGERVVFAVWDVLFHDGVDVCSRPLSERVTLLQKICAGAHEPLVVSERVDGTPAAVLRSLDAMHVRGYVARSESSTYPPAEGAAWTCAGSHGPIAWERSLSAPPKVTNQDKVLYPRDGLTKADIAAYYADVAAPLLRVMHDRPVVCQRWPDGIDDFTWFQHRMPPRAPDYLRAVWIEGNRRVVIETVEGLLWMVNQAALTFHGWTSRVASLQSPDWVILDLDPGEETRWETVIDVALAIRKLLEMLELPSVVKTSGQKGLHILIPIAPGHTTAQTHELAMRMAMLVARLYPAEVSLEAQSEPRRGRLYLDHLQNFTGKSLVLPYSLRAVDGAPASTPITWSEVVPTLAPRDFSLRTVRARLDRVGDLAAPLTAGHARLAPALARLSARAV